MKEKRVKDTKNTKKKCDAGLVSLWIFVSLLIASLIAIIVALCVFHSSVNFVPKKHHARKQHISTSQVTTADGWIVTNGSKIIEKMAKQDDFVLYIAKSNCSDCQTFTETLKTALTNVKNPELFYFDVAANKDDSYILDNLKVSELPALLYINDGEVYDRLDNWQDQSAVNHFIVKYNK
jgi:thioredoxin-like negative regulator of GroEL